MVGVGWGGGCCWILARYKKLKRGRGEGGRRWCCRFLARYEKQGGGRYDRVLGGPGYSTVVEFLRAGINRQCKCAAIIIKCGPKSYQFINGGEGGGGHVLMSLWLELFWYARYGTSPLVWLCMCM